MDPQEPKPKRRPRFSLLNLLFLIAAVAASASAYRTGVEIKRVQQDNLDIQNRLFSLDYKSPHRGRARLINGHLELLTYFRWQFYSPEEIPSQLVLNSGGERTTLALPGGPCAVQISCVQRDGSGWYSIGIEPTALGVGGFQPNWDARGKAELTTQLAPPWQEHGLEKAQLECLGPWPLPEGTVGTEQSWDASKPKVLLQSWVRGERTNLGVRLTAEPVTTAPAVR